MARVPGPRLDDGLWPDLLSRLEVSPERLIKSHSSIEVEDGTRAKVTLALIADIDMVMAVLNDHIIQEI